MATSTTPKAAKKAVAPRKPAPAIDFGKIATKEADPVIQTRNGALDKTPIPGWLADSWAARTTVQRGGNERVEGAARELSAMSREQVDYTKNLLSRGVQRMPGVGVKFSETVNGDGSVTLKFQTMQRKARKASK